MDHKIHARNVFNIESAAISNLSSLLTDDFNGAVDAILRTTGRTIISGMGKSGIIGRKIAATLASTGTPSFFMHPGEAFHGDLGMITSEDVFIAISNSGETDEVLKLLPFLRDNKNTVITFTSSKESTLSRSGHFYLNVSVPQEACPLQLAPTSSTTAALAMGDALSIALMEARCFKPENFARFHPGGNLGRKLLRSVEDEMDTKDLPITSLDSSIMDVISTMTSGRLGLAVIVNKFFRVEGVVTDGDLRRALAVNCDNFFSMSAEDIMSRNPITISPNALVAEAIDFMEGKNVNRLLVHDRGKLVGVLRK